MALIKCPECGSEISEQAEECPKCAFPINAPKKTSSTIRVICALFGVGFLALCFGGRFIFFFPYDTAILGGLLLLVAIFTK